MDNYRLFLTQFRDSLEGEARCGNEHAKGLLRLMDIHQDIWSDTQARTHAEEMDRNKIKAVIGWKD